MSHPPEMRRLRASSSLVVASLASASLASLASMASSACSSSSPGSSAVAPVATGPDAGAGVAFALEGVYVVTDADAGAPADPLDTVGDVWRFHDGAYSFHPVVCAAATPTDDDAGASQGDDDAGGVDGADGGVGVGDADRDFAVFPPNFTDDGACDESGSYVISADGTTLALTSAADGATTTESFVPLEWLAPQAAGDADGDAGVAAQTLALRRAGEIAGGLVTPGGAVIRTSDVTLLTKGGKLLTAVGCSGVSAASGSASGAFIRLASDVGLSCLQSQLTLPTYDIPAGPNGAPYCTSFSGDPGCTTSNYYGRHGVPFIYDEFLGSGNPAECGFEYMPGPPVDGAQGQPRWVPYVRGDSGYYRYGQTGDGSVVNGAKNNGVTEYLAGTSVTLLCTVDGNGHLQMKVNGAPMYDADDPKTPHALLTSPQSFTAGGTHVMRVSAIAWPETMGKTASQVSALMAAKQYFPPYTCQPLDKLQVTYTSTLACSTGAGTPSTPYKCGSSGNATWSPNATGIGYTLTPKTEVSDVPSGNACTDTLFPTGG